MKKLTGDKVIAYGAIWMFAIMTAIILHPIKGKADVPKIEFPITEIPYVEGEVIVERGNFVSIEGNLNPEQKQKYWNELVKRKDIYAKQIQAEIWRKWKLNIEQEKFKNALMLERAGAPVTVVNTTQGTRPTAQTFPFVSHSPFEKADENK